MFGRFDNDRFTVVVEDVEAVRLAAIDQHHNCRQSPRSSSPIASTVPAVHQSCAKRWCVP